MHHILNHKIYPVENNNDWLILIHGLFGSQDNLAATRRYFEGKCNLLTVDLPDHGESYHQDKFTLETASDAIIALMDELNIEHAALLGHSLGGKVAMLTALCYPQRVSQLIIADIAPVNYPHRHQDVFDGLNAVDLTTIRTRGDADKAMQPFLKEAGTRAFLLKSLYQPSSGNWAWRFNLTGLIASYDELRSWTKTSKTFDKPVLFIKGGDSDYIAPSHQSEIARLFPKARAHIIQGAGHWLHAEKPEAFNRIVEKHLQFC